MIFFHSRFAALRQLKLVKNIGEFWILADGKAVQNIFCSIPDIIPVNRQKFNSILVHANEGSGTEGIVAVAVNDQTQKRFLKCSFRIIPYIDAQQLFKGRMRLVTKIEKCIHIVHLLAQGSSKLASISGDRTGNALKDTHVNRMFTLIGKKQTEIGEKAVRIGKLEVRLCVASNFTFLRANSSFAALKVRFWFAQGWHS